MATMKNKGTARKTIDAEKFNEMMEMIHTEHHRLKGENEDLKIENEKLKEKYEKIRVRSCDRNQELVKALSPWKKNQEDHKRILEAIVELKGENEHFKRKIQKLEKENECLKEDMVRLENENTDKKFEMEDLYEECGGHFVDANNLKEENDKLKEKINGYEALLRCECGVSIERVVEIKDENKKLKEESKRSSKMIGDLRHYEDFVYSSDHTEDEFKEFLEMEGLEMNDDGDIVDKPDSDEE